MNLFVVSKAPDAPYAFTRPCWSLTAAGASRASFEHSPVGYGFRLSIPWAFPLSVSPAGTAPSAMAQGSHMSKFPLTEFDLPLARFGGLSGVFLPGGIGPSPILPPAPW